MSRLKLFFGLLFKAAWIRKDRSLTAFVAAAVVATMATTALTVYFDLENKLSREFRSFGANVVVTKQGSLSTDELAKIDSVLGEKSEVVPVAYSIGTLDDGTRVVVGGADLAKLENLNSWWSIKHGLPTPPALVGARLDAKTGGAPFSFKPGSGSKAAMIVRGGDVFTSGADDDSRIYIPLDEFIHETGIEPNTALIRVVGRPVEIQSAIARLSAALPQLEVKPVRQITQAQTAVVDKTGSVVLASSAVIVVLIVLCMAATFANAVFERRRDFAVMKALGASNATVNMMFAAEASLLALAGAAAGFVAGSAIAYWIGRANFNAAILPQPALLLPVMAGSVALALFASAWSLARLQQIQPAGILRGE
jgi:putative ABC transport system permease protein